MTRCDNCGFDSTPLDRFCKNCGAALPTSEIAGHTVPLVPPIGAPGLRRQAAINTWQKWLLGSVAGLLVVVIVIAIATGPDESKELGPLASDAIASASPSPEPGSDFFQPTTAAPTIPTRAPVVAAPTPRPTRAPPPPRQQPAPFTITGSGQRASELFEIEGGVTLFRLSHQGTSNFAVWLKTEAGEETELLVNEIGVFNGSKLAGVSAGSYLFDVAADGPWSVTVEQPRPASAPGPPRTVTGSTQAGAGPIHLSGGLVRFELRHSGDSNFAVWLIDDAGENVALLANDIGPFNGSKAESVDEGIYWFDVTANASWSIAVTQ